MNACAGKKQRVLTGKAGGRQKDYEAGITGFQGIG